MLRLLSNKWMANKVKQYQYTVKVVQSMAQMQIKNKIVLINSVS